MYIYKCKQYFLLNYVSLHNLFYPYHSLRTMNKLPLDSFFGTKDFVKSVELQMQLSKEIFTPKDLGVTYTNITYWDKQGILSSQRDGDAKWRNFSFIDYAWLKVIEELRDMGIPTKLIKEAKECLFESVDVKPLYKEFNKHIPEVRKAMSSLTEAEKDEAIELMLEGQKRGKDKNFTYFYFTLLQSILLKEPVSLLIFNDGGVMTWFENKSSSYDKESFEEKLYGTYISVSISKIIKNFLVDDRSVFLLPQLQLLQSNEIRLLELINSGSYDNITIKFRDKKMKSLELKKTQDTKKKMVDILTEGAYQDIVIKSHKGMVTHIENTVKIMLD